MHAAITAALGFLVAVRWFDLMFDVQVLAHRAEPQVPDNVVDSISTYYRRVTTDASPMGRLVALVMALTRVVPNAVRLGARLDPPSARSNLARGILRDHVVFLALIVAVLVVQLAAG